MQKTLKRYFPIFVLPTLLAFAVAFLIPFIMGIYLSFCNFTTVIDARFTGISNYARMFSNQDFLSALSFTARFTVVSVILINAGAFLLALALTKGIKGTNLYRTVFFMPNLIGGIVLGYIWQLIINAVLLRSGVTITTNAKYGFWGLVILMGWQMIGYMMIIYIAGIQNISTELMEAAKIDGATNLQILGKITIPLVMPSITICLFLAIVRSFMVFEVNMTLTDGGPFNSTEMIALRIYNRAFVSLKFGDAQAQAVVLFVIVAVISVLQAYFTSRREVQM